MIKKNCSFDTWKRNLGHSLTAVITNCSFFKNTSIRNFLILIIAQHSSRKHKQWIKKTHFVNTGRTPRFFSEAFHVTIIYVFFNGKNLS